MDGRVMDDRAHTYCIFIKRDARSSAASAAGLSFKVLQKSILAWHLAMICHLFVAPGINDLLADMVCAAPAWLGFTQPA